MTKNDWLFLQCIVIFGMMAVLFLAKQKSRKDGLPRFVKKHARRQRYIRYTPTDTAPSDDSETSIDVEEDVARESEEI